MWNLSPNERLQAWRKFRKQLDTKSLEQAIADTNHLWSYAPYVSRYLLPESTQDWPDPWRLIYDNHYCDIAKALGMLYTMYLTKHASAELELEFRVYRCGETGNWSNCVWINQGKYILNMIFDEVVNTSYVPEHMILVHQYQLRDLPLDQK